MALGTFVRLWDMDGEAASVVAEEFDRIDCAVQRWLDTGRDEILDLTTIGGESLRILASRVTRWRRTTPEGRATAMHFEKQTKDEYAALCSDVGLPNEDEPEWL